MPPQKKPWEEYQEQAGPWTEYQAPQQDSQKKPLTEDSSSQPSLMDRIKGYLPTWRTAAQVTGATAGGVLGAAGGPAGVALGGTLGAGAGESLYQLIQRARGASDLPQSSLEAAEEMRAAMAGGALQEGIGAALPPLSSALARKLYRSSLRPSTGLTTKKAAEISNNFLKERIPVTPEGVLKGNDLIEDLGTQIDARIASNPSAELNPDVIAGRVDPTIANFKYGDLQKDMMAASGEKARFLNEHSTQVPFSPYPPPHSPGPIIGGKPINPVTPQEYRLPTPIPANKAQFMKKSIWRELAPSDFGTVAPGYREARHNIGSGLRKGLEDFFPDIGPLNAREGRLIEGMPHLERAVNRGANRDIIGLGGPVLGAATEMATGNPILAGMAALAKNSGSRTAILLDRLAGKIGGITPAALPRFAAIPAIQAVRRRF